jgi:hypothetical protein
MCFYLHFCIEACGRYRGLAAFKAIKLKTRDRDLLKLGGAIVAALVREEVECLLNVDLTLHPIDLLHMTA